MDREAVEPCFAVSLRCFFPMKKNLSKRLLLYYRSQLIPAKDLDQTRPLGSDLVPPVAIMPNSY